MSAPADPDDDASERLPFLEALGLDGGADERAVRRAYARRLKALDPETDPRGFQALREAYEAALGWLAWRERQAAAAEPPAPPPEAEAPPPPPAEPTPAETSQQVDAPTPVPAPAPAATPAPAAPAAQPDLSDGQAVYDAFAARVAAVFADEPAARRALDEALADPRLVNLEARTYFEWCVGCLLMNGWQPGHEFLFGPACEAFDWTHDRRRLGLYGNLGVALDRAIEEKLLFHRQDAGVFEAQRAMIRRLRGDVMPSDVELRNEVPTLLGVVQRFPNWLQAISSVPNLRRWHERFAQLEPLPTPAQRPTPAFEAALDAGAKRPWLPLLGLVIVLSAMANFMGSQQRPPQARADEIRRMLQQNNAGTLPPAAPAPWQAAPAGTPVWPQAEPVLITPGAEAPRARPKPASRASAPASAPAPAPAGKPPPAATAARLPSLAEPPPLTTYELVPRGGDPASAPRLGP